MFLQAPMATPTPTKTNIKSETGSCKVIIKKYKNTKKINSDLM